MGGGPFTETPDRTLPLERHEGGQSGRPRGELWGEIPGGGCESLSARTATTPSASVLAGGRRLLLERLDVAGGGPVAVDAPVAALDLLDDDPGDRAQRLTLDVYHRVGEPGDHLALLEIGEDAFDELD